MRKKLTEAIMRQAGEYGYTPYSGSSYMMTGEVKALPAMWIEPPVLTGITGTDEGVVTYNVTMRLMCAGNAVPQKTKERNWAKMERDAVAVFKALGDEKSVHSVGKLSCEPGEYTLTGHGELSCTACFEVSLFYCKSKNK